MHYKIWERSRFWLPLSEADFQSYSAEQKQKIMSDIINLALEDDHDVDEEERSIEEHELQRTINQGPPTTSQSSSSSVDGIHIIADRVRMRIASY
jgi:hypothetical protein